MELSLNTGRISWSRAEVHPAGRIYVTPNEDILTVVSIVFVMLEVKRTRPIVEKEVDSD